MAVMFPPADRPQSNHVPFLDIQGENEPLLEEILTAMRAVCESGQFVLGPACQQLECEIAALCQTEYAVGCASGSDALLLALMALNVAERDEVIVPSFTFFATASAVYRLKAQPVFVDIDSATFNMDPRLVERAITRRTKAIIPVHLFGQPAQMDVLVDMARRRGVFVVEDAAQSLGARYAGRPVGSWGDVGCFSFYPTKNLGGMGDGGMLTTSDRKLAERLKLLRLHGMQPRYYHRVVGINSRLDALQAAALSVKLSHLARWTEARRHHATQYAKLFRRADLDSCVALPVVGEGCEHVWNQYTVRVTGGRRDALRDHLTRTGIGTEIYYPIPLHRQECFRALGYLPGSLPHTERAAGEVLSLPIFPSLTAHEQECVVGAVREFFLATAERKPAA